MNAIPGPIDIHLHGIEGFDTRTGSSDEILHIAEIMGTAGVSIILLSIYPAPVAVMRRNIAAVKDAIDRQRSAISDQRSEGQDLPDTLRPALVLGVHLEGPFLNPTRCGALDPQTFLTPSWYNYRKLTEGFEETVKSITFAPELQNAPQVIRQIADSGVAVSMGHSDANYSEAEEGFHAGATGITHIFNAMRPFTHRDPGISGFALINPGVYVEVIADPYHLHLETIRLVFRTKPLDRILIVSDAVKGISTGIFAGEDKQKKINQPVPLINDMGRLKGGSMSIIMSSARLITAGFSEVAVRSAITENPARFLNL